MGLLQSCCFNQSYTIPPPLEVNKNQEENKLSSNSSESEEGEDNLNNKCECPAPKILEIPLAGNAYITTSTTGGINEVAKITENGLTNWMTSDSDCICTIYFYLSNPNGGNFLLSLRLSVPQVKCQSQIKVFLSNDNNSSDENNHCQCYTVDIEGTEFHDVQVGQFKKSGGSYVKLNLQGTSKTGDFYADVSHVLITDCTTTATSSSVCENMLCVTDDFYFGRRGPSVHLNYEIPLTCCEGIEYFYNEVSVPSGYDTIGSYFCAIAFSSGYFGIQVNSCSERRILFSIWSTYCTDDPNQIPEDFKVKLNKKGQNVCIGEFGNEGSGGQSYLLYNWKPELIYKFIVRGIPIDENNSEFRSWFYSPEEKDWKLIASMIQPKKSTYLSNIYSFCENFIPENGHIERMAYYGNQWIYSKLKWYQVIKAKFTADETSKHRYDFAGGVTEDGNKFYLKNGGFFNGKVKTNQIFVREFNSSDVSPGIVIAKLP